jgi:hypothetical protein
MEKYNFLEILKSFLENSEIPFLENGKILFLENYH